MIMKKEEMKITELYDLTHTLASDYLKQFTYPWEALAGLSDFIIELGNSLDPEEYEKRGENIWVHKTAKVFDSAYLHGPVIVGKDAEVRHCAFIRGSALNALISESKDLDAPEYKCMHELMDAVDTWIPTPDRKADQPFLMPVEDVFTISGRGTVATGRVERGQLKLGEEVEIIGLTDERRKTVVTGIEMFHKLLDYAEAGDNIGTLLRGVAKNEIERGQVLSKPGSIHPLTKFVGQVYVLNKDEGGRHTPFFNNYRPQFYFRTTDVTGVITLPEGTEMCMPGDNVDMNVELITPIAIEKGLRFAIREGGRTVGSGVVIECKD